MRAVPTIDRVLAKTAMGPNGCIIFTGSLDQKGYGRIRCSQERRTARVHRVMYEHFVGPIPAGLVLDHLCRVPRCCNPYHLEPVTNLENYLRGDRKSGITQCPAGHPYSEANTYLYVTGSGQRRRHCRICRRLMAKPIPVEDAQRYQQARQQLVREAATALGITQPELKRLHGTSKKTLRRLIEENK